MDKLDKTIEELQKGKKKKVVEKPTTNNPLLPNILYGQCARCGGHLTSDHKCREISILDVAREHPEIITEEIDREIIEKIEEHVKNKQHEWIGTSKLEQNLQEEIKQVGVVDTYLPFVLTKLNFCGNNTEARKLIANGKVKINNNVVNLMYNTKELSNFLLEVNGVKYEIFKVD